MGEQAVRISTDRQVKGEVHEASEGEQRYSSTLALTSVLDCGWWSTPCPGRFTTGNDPVPIE
jgi:hypothetical protein